jgi:hypothetical protein
MNKQSEKTVYEPCSGTEIKEKGASKYAQIMAKIEEQKLLVSKGIIEKPKPVNNFTAKDWEKYEKGISIEEYADKRGIVLL